MSGGDKTTYTKTVNHAKHNTDFFYALLVVKKNQRGDPRYQVKHFFFRRGDPNIYEVAAADVTIKNLPLYTVEDRKTPTASGKLRAEGGTNVERATDQQFFAEFYPDLKPMFSKKIGVPYWKGLFPLIDGSLVDIVAIESVDGAPPTYTITMAGKNAVIAEMSPQYQDRQFPSARHAVIQLQRDLNQALYRAKAT
ncbi:hypothetical protein ACVWZK_000214 [Bradyrhizobium sp. GM0.4]